jgi:hypothetical protein
VLVASGQIVHPTGAGLPLAQRSDITLLPLTGLPPLRLGPIWCTAHENARIRGGVVSAITGRSDRWPQYGGRDAAQRVFGDLERISGCRHRPLSGRVVTYCDWLTRFLVGRGGVHASVVPLGEPATGVYDACFLA